jgi:hypothetical protein
MNGDFSSQPIRQALQAAAAIHKNYTRHRFMEVILNE